MASQHKIGQFTILLGGGVLALAVEDWRLKIATKEQFYT